MKLNIEDVRAIACGVESVSEEKGGFMFHRFTKEQSDAYAIYRDAKFANPNCTHQCAGVRLAMQTDTSCVSFDYEISNFCFRRTASFDIYVDGVMINHIWLDVKDERATGTAEVDLPTGMKNVEIYLPWSSTTLMKNITIDDGAVFTPLKRRYTMLNYGDSITHGVYTAHTSLTYSSTLARLLDADNINKAISGDRFFPELLERDEEIKPDIVTVAYGANDWRWHRRETVIRRSGDFINAVSAKYPEAKIFVISPLWRSETTPQTEKFDGPLSDVHDILAKHCASHLNTVVIDGRKLVPHIPEFYHDGLHPNDTGMSIYAANLYRFIMTYL